MNVERLRTIIGEVWDDLRRTELIARMTELEQALTQAVGSPAEPSYQEAVADARRAVDAALGESVISDLPPASREVLADLGVSTILGDDLQATLDGLFQRNQVTMTEVQAGVAELRTGLAELLEQLGRLISSLDFLGIAGDDLLPGECEIDLLLPRPFVDNSVGGLGKELATIEKIIRPFQELATGTTTPLEIKTISSSNFLISVLLDPDTAAGVAKTLAWVLAQYLAVMNVRKIAQDLREANIPASEELASKAEESAKTLIEDSIEGFVSEVLNSDAANLRGEGRDQEVRAQLKFSVLELTRRVDYGVQIQVRALPPETTGAEEPDEDDAHGGAPTPYETIAELQPEMEFLRLEGEPILFELSTDASSDGPAGDETRPEPS